MEFRFTVGGLPKRVTTDDVFRKLRNFKPGPVRTHGVKIRGVTYPVKEALAQVTGLDPLDFNTYQARSVFKGLGFQVVRLPKRARSQ